MTAVDASAAARRFGRFELRALVGRSERSMAWHAFDARIAQDVLLVLPRRQPAQPEALAQALAWAQRAARVAHPHLAHAIEVDQQERWPYIAYDYPAGGTLADRPAAREGHEPEAIARWMSQAAAALAFAHDAGFAHQDVQPWLLTLDEGGQVRLAGLGADGPEDAWTDAPSTQAEQRARRDARVAAERDVLALVLVLQGLLTGRPALDEPDIGVALRRLAPWGGEWIRLPWDVPRPVPEPLRIIANRGCDRQVRQRYRHARTLGRALQGWLDAEAGRSGDAHSQFIARVRELGVLPASPGAAERAARLAMMDRRHTEALAQVVLDDAALTLELLRGVNSAQVRGTQVSGNGTVLTVRRAIAMIGLDGVRRTALAMRNWPGPLDDAAARELQQAIAAAQRAARLAQALRPPGYDQEIVALVTLLQNLGRLLLHYHASDEMQQIRRLMRPEPGEGSDAVMTERTASQAVLGCDIDSIALAVARWMGLGGSDDAALVLMRRLPLDKAVRTPVTDDEILRALGSAANEAVDALALPEADRAAAVARVAKRHARWLELTPQELSAALQASARGRNVEAVAG
jgi:non-specific serine/threonine protein kinase